MVSNSAKLDRRTKQHTQFGVSASNGSRDMGRTKSRRKKKKKKIKKNEHRQSHKASPTGIANYNVWTSVLQGEYFNSGGRFQKWIGTRIPSIFTLRSYIYVGLCAHDSLKIDGDLRSNFAFCESSQYISFYHISVIIPML